MSHAKLSPSSAARWLACPGSVPTSAGIPDKTSSYADEGSRAHALAEDILDDGMIEKDDYPPAEYPPEMHEYVMQYVDAVMAEVKHEDILLVEQRLPIGQITGEESATGTGDAIVIKPVEAQIHDLKYGMGVQVYASERVPATQFQDSEAGRAFLALIDPPAEDGTVEVPNSQCGMYGLGTIHEYGIAYDFAFVRMFIHQPRLDHISSFLISVKALEAWGEWVKTRVELVRCAEAYEEVAPAEEFYGMYFNPGEKQCRWCRAKATCVPLANFVAKAIANDFDDKADPPKLEEVKKVETPAPAFLGIAMAKVDLVEDWCRAVRGEVESNLIAGRPVAGWKLVEGRKGARQWTVKEEADLEKLRRRYKIPVWDFYERKAISPAGAEKKFKTRPLWEKLQAVIVQTRGKPSVAPASDKRPAVQTATTADDFATHED